MSSVDPRITEFGLPPAASGAQRAIPIFGVILRYSIPLAILVLALVVVLENTPLAPSRALGRVFGNIWAAEQDAARRAAVLTTEQQTEAQLIPQMRQSMAVMGAMPKMLGAWAFGADCALTQKPSSCAKADAIARDLTRVPDSTRSGASQGGDVEPLKQVEFEIIARYEQSLIPRVVEEAKHGLDLSTNSGLRRYLANLRTAAGDTPARRDNDPNEPVIIYPGQNP